VGEQLPELAAELDDEAKSAIWVEELGDRPCFQGGQHRPDNFGRERREFAGGLTFEAFLQCRLEAPSEAEARPGQRHEAVTDFARTANGSLIVTASGLTLAHRGLIITLAAKHKLPAVYPFGYLATDGGLISYGPDSIDQYRRAAGYVDRILKGEKPADLSVQAPTKYELVINLKTAKALGLEIPSSVLARADEVIE
jgi:ABC transporter substrate binding protein